MSNEIIIAAAYLILTAQGSGLSNDVRTVIPYSSMKECEDALSYLNKQPYDEDIKKCVPGSTDWHDRRANKPTQP